jgi:hypothetical protein
MPLGGGGRPADVSSLPDLPRLNSFTAGLALSSVSTSVTVAVAVAEASWSSTGAALLPRPEVFFGTAAGFVAPLTCFVTPGFWPIFDGFWFTNEGRSSSSPESGTSYTFCCFCVACRAREALGGALGFLTAGGLGFALLFPSLAFGGLSSEVPARAALLLGLAGSVFSVWAADGDIEAAVASRRFLTDGAGSGAEKAGPGAALSSPSWGRARLERVAGGFVAMGGEIWCYCERKGCIV